MEKGAQFEEVSGDTFDLGNATEEEWQDIFLHEIFATMLGDFNSWEIFLRYLSPDK